jgi:hypothetical protein
LSKHDRRLQPEQLYNLEYHRQLFCSKRRTGDVENMRTSRWDHVGGPTRFELTDHTVKKGSFAEMHKTLIIIVQKPEQQPPLALQVVPVVGLQGHRKPTRIWHRRCRSPFGNKGCWARSQLLVPCAMGLSRRLAGPFATRSHLEIVALPSCQDGCNRKPSRRHHQNRREYIGGPQGYIRVWGSMRNFWPS